MICLAPNEVGVLPNAWYIMYPSPKWVYWGNALYFGFASETEAELAKMNSQIYFNLQISVNVTSLYGLIATTREYWFLEFTCNIENGTMLFIFTNTYNK